MPQDLQNPPLNASDLSPDPMVQLERWLHDARAAGLMEPTAMTLATVDPDGKPSARIVLFKGFHEGRLTFYTHHESRKGRALAAHPDVSLVFWWDRLERQVRIEGRAQKLPRAMAERYFRSRPRESQLSAYTSHQSRVIADRAELEARLAQNEKRFAGQDVSLPEFWGGYAVRPGVFEFWQGRRGRLHDRLVYRRAGRAWRMERLEP